MRPAPDEPRFSVRVALLAWFAAYVAAAVAIVLLVGLLGYSGTESEDWPIWVVFVVQLPFWGAYLAAVVLVSQRFGTGDPKRDYGLRFRRLDLLGVPIGVLLQLVFVPALYFPFRSLIDEDELSETARQLTDRATGGAGWVLLFLLVVVGAPIVEELFFRGLLLRSFQAHWSDSLALVATSVLFGSAHVQGLSASDLLPVPALILFGLVAGYAAQRTGRLGPSIALHAGFNFTTVVLLTR